MTEADDDPMNEVLASLGPIPEDEAMLGDKSTEFGLVLTNKWELNMSDESNIQALFSKTKYLIVDLLKIQRGETFTAILHTAANTQQQVTSSLLSAYILFYYHLLKFQTEMFCMIHLT